MDARLSNTNTLLSDDEQDILISLNQRLRNYDEYNKKPFMSFVNAQTCKVETEEQVFQTFKEWLTCQTEGFLYTFEPKPSLSHLNIGKCPYFHTGKIFDERGECKTKKDFCLKQNLENFLKKRFILIQRLLDVYKKAKEDIENEYYKDMSRKDPFCSAKRKMATKIIVDMMIKQFALEYLYLKAIKLKKEIALTNSTIQHNIRTRYLINIYKYTIKTAEKLRCLLELECTEEHNKPEIYFEELTLRDMARMYLNEMENMATSFHTVQYVEPSTENLEKRSDTEIWEEIPQVLTEGMSDILENNFSYSYLREESVKEIVGVTETAGSTNVESVASGNQEVEITEEEDKVISENQKELSRKLIDDIIFPEEPLSIMADMRREILKPEYSVSDKTFGEIPPQMDFCDEMEKQEIKEDPRIALLDTNMAEIEILEEFKRELWLIESFKYFTNIVRPDLANKYKLVHFKCKFDKLLQTPAETVFSDGVSIINSALKECLVYIKRAETEAKNKKHFTSDMEPQNITSADSDESNSLQQLGSNGNEDTLEDTENSIQSVQSSVDNNIQDYTWHLKRGESMSTLKGAFEEVLEQSSSLSTNSEENLFKNSPQLIKSLKEHDSAVSRGSSIPSCGSIPDPFKKYKKCLKSELKVYEFEDNNENMESEEKKSEDLHDPCFISTMKSKSVDSKDRMHFEIRRKDERYFTSLEDSKRNLPRKLYKDNQSEVSDKSQCFPTLIEVLNNFTKTLKSQSFSTQVYDKVHKKIEEGANCDWYRYCELDECLLEGDEVKETEANLINWEDILNMKWPMSQDSRTKNIFLSCEYDTAEIIKELKNANMQYLRSHPEIAAMITLILREFSKNRPENDFVKFIKKTVHDKYFAKRISSYLMVNNKGYNRRKGHSDCRVGTGFYQSQSRKMFTFDKPAAKYWKDWSVDYKIMSEKYGNFTDQSDREILQDSTHYHDKMDKCTGKCTDPWDLESILECLKKAKVKDGKTDDVGISSGWVKYIKSLENKQKREIKKETAIITAIANEHELDIPQNIRKSCQ